MNTNIGGIEIGAGRRPFVIAEMSGNHNQSLDQALSIVRAAAECGVQALKLQTYTADTITMDCQTEDFRITNPNSLWYGRYLYDLYQEGSTPWEWHEAIFKECKKLGLLCFSTPFDETAVDFLEQFDVPCYKIASFENIHIPLIRKAASTGKPLIISTGMATVAELDEAVREARNAGAPSVILLKCTSNYPASPEHSNLLTIPHMKQLFQCEAGVSDHTLGIGAAIAAIALGASVVEKHFTISRAAGGVDAAFSLEPQEMKQLVEEANRAWQSLGCISYGPGENEKKSMKSRRSIYVAKNIKAGEQITEEHIRVVRPGLGLPPKYFDQLIGMTVTRDLERGTAFQWEYVRKDR